MIYQAFRGTSKKKTVRTFAPSLEENPLARTSQVRDGMKTEEINEDFHNRYLFVLSKEAFELSANILNHYKMGLNRFPSNVRHVPGSFEYRNFSEAVSSLDWVRK